MEMTSISSTTNPRDIIKSVENGNLQEVKAWIAKNKTICHAIINDNTFNEVGSTLLHIAANNNQIQIVEELLKAGADPNIQESKTGRTALHYACYRKNLAMVEALLEKGAKLNIQDNKNTPPTHVAARSGQLCILQVMIQHVHDPPCISIEGGYGELPIHKACEFGHVQTAELLLDENSDVDARDSNGNSPLCWAGSGATVELLLKRGATADGKSIESAIKRGRKSTAIALLNSKYWKQLLRHKYRVDGRGEETTSFRQLIDKMPSVAEIVLNRCTVDNGHPDPGYIDYEVGLNFEFLEDVGIDDVKQDPEMGNLASNKILEMDTVSEFYKVYGVAKGEMDIVNNWGPKKFSKNKHPLAIMAESNPHLLTHSLVKTLLKIKWNKYGWLYYIHLSFYIAFLLCLTVFALLVPNPKSNECNIFLNVSSALNQTDGDESGDGNSFRVCEKNVLTRQSIYFFASMVILCGLCQLVHELYQILKLKLKYFSNWHNYVDLLVFTLSALFAFLVFPQECQCFFIWQWQIGTVAILLAWFNLILYLTKLPFFGIYMLVFVNILKTFLKVIVLYLILVLGFALTFYMCFYEPSIQRSPFSNPGRSFFRTMTMSVGEINTDGVFRLDSAGESDKNAEIPFLGISYYIWIIFIFLLPLLLINQLIGLAVGDTSAIIKKSEINKLILQVEQVLTIEELLPKRLRVKWTKYAEIIHPNKTKSSCEKLSSIFFWDVDSIDTQDGLIEAVQNRVANPSQLDQPNDLTERLDNINKTINQVQMNVQMLLSISVKDLDHPKEEQTSATYNKYSD